MTMAGDPRRGGRGPGSPRPGRSGRRPPPGRARPGGRASRILPARLDSDGGAETILAVGSVVEGTEPDRHQLEESAAVPLVDAVFPPELTPRRVVVRMHEFVKQGDLRRAGRPVHD